jgi:hypothetical protein
MKNNRITYSTKEAIIVFRSGKTTNKKIAQPKETIVQTYSFSKEQYNYVLNSDKIGEKIIPKRFFDLADSVCFDCPFNSYGKCYTHKFMQYNGFLSMLRSLIKVYGSTSNIEPLSPTQLAEIVSMCESKYVRFGTYGEPSLIDVGLVAKICDKAKSWTGYTHQWLRTDYSKYFMASVHNVFQAITADKKGYRSFIASKTTLEEDLISCPASKESGFKSDCSKCGLCSGTTGKGKKSVIIIEH